MTTQDVILKTCRRRRTIGRSGESWSGISILAARYDDNDIYILKRVGPQRDLYFLEFIYLFCSYMRICFQLVAFVRELIWQKALLMGCSMNLELTRVCCLNDFQLVIGLYRGHPLFLLESVYLRLLLVLYFPNSHFPFWACECGSWWFLCVCMCGSVDWNLLVTIFLLIIFVSVYIYTYLCMFVCMKKKKIYIYMCVCVCVCVCISSLMISSENVYGKRSI